MLGKAIGTSCLLLALSATANASDEDLAASEEQSLLLSGSVDLSAGFVSMDIQEESDEDYPNDTGRFSGEARVNLPFFNDFSLQLDLIGEADSDNDYGSDNTIDDYESLVQGGAHLSYRSADQYLFGVWGSLAEVQVQNQDSETVWMGGLEAQYYLGNTTFYGQAGLLSSSNRDPASETMEHAQFGRAVVRHFIDANLSVAAEALYGRGDDGANDTHYIEFASWGVEAEKRFSDYPVALSLAYEGNYIGNSRDVVATTEGDEKLVEHVFMAGVSFKFGSSTLLQEDRYGATLDLPVSPLRAAVYAADIVD